jgi:hypothetical protein
MHSTATPAFVAVSVLRWFLATAEAPRAMIDNQGQMYEPSQIDIDGRKA